MTIRQTIARALGTPKWREEIHQTDKSQVKRLWDAVLQATGNPLLVHFVAKLIEKAKIPARDPEKLARALQLYSARRIKFFRERPERFQHPLRTIVWGIGDCDDKTIFIASSLRTFRVPVRLIILRLTVPVPNGPPRKLGHVYPQAYYAGAWHSLESVREYPPDYDPEKRARERGFGVEKEIIGDPIDTLYA